jgi:inner membrane transporter RhtA
VTDRHNRSTAIGLVVGAACSVQIGAAVAKSLFDSLGPPGVVFLRLLFGSIALWAIARPTLRGRPTRDYRLLVALGVILVSMNLLFYESLDRLPLGIAVTVEFLGPLGLAVITSHRRLDLIWVAFAGLGVALLAEGGGEEVHALGVVLALAAGVCWALFIIVGTKIGRSFEGPTALAPAMLLGAALCAPWGIASARGHLREATLLGAGVGVALLSSALPWSLELEAMRRLPPSALGVVVSLEPAVAALAGFFFLHEHLDARAWFAIGLVIVASAGGALRRAPPQTPDV